MKVQPNLQEKVLGYIVTPELVIDTTTDKEELIFSFSTYGWSYPTQYKSGIHKNGITGKLENPGQTRMKEACSGKKTSVPEEPFVIKGSERKWQIPNSVSLGLKINANRFAKKFDKECNKRLSNFRTKNYGDKMVGEEWYKLSSSEVMSIREEVWKSLVKKEQERIYKESLQPKLPIQLKPGLQEAAVERVHDQIREGKKRFKGIAPTGFGKTVLAWFIFTDAYKKGLINGRISIMTAPSQFLCNKNAVAFDNYNKRNSVSDFINLPIFSGSDLGIHEDENSTSKRKERLKNQLVGYLKEDDKKIILHVCNNSMKLISEILFEIKIDYIDLQIADEAHTLTSKKNNEDITGDLGNIRNFCLFDDNIIIKHRFFLTATEKNLINPDNLEGKEIFAFMNNEEFFGDYAFKFSYAECVVDGLIVPFVAKIFEYSNQQKDVIKMIQEGIDSFMLDDLTIQDQDGDVTSLHLRLIRVLVSSLKIVRSEERRKLLLICSRNSHADLLEKSLNFLKQSGKYKEIENVNIDKITTPYYPKPENRFEELELIHESDEQHIIICGPWAITGVDCPSIDSILWAFNPGNEISAAQGTGRGTRTHLGKSNLLVAFNLDLELGLNDIKNQLLITVSKLYDGLFPQHDLELRKKVRKIIGKRFLSTEKDEEATVTVHVRALLSEFYDAAETVELFEFVNSSAFKNGGKPIFYDFLEIQDIAQNSECSTLTSFYEYIKTREDQEFFPSFSSLSYTIQLKKIKIDVFFGVSEAKKFKKKLVKDARKFVLYCKRNGFTSKYAMNCLREKWKPLCPFNTLTDKYEGVLNPDYDVNSYLGIKKGIPVTQSIDEIFGSYNHLYPNISNELDEFVSAENLEKIIKQKRISSLSEYRTFYTNNKEWCIMVGLPNVHFLEKGVLYDKFFVQKILPRKSWREKITKSKCLELLNLIESEKKKDVNFNRKSVQEITGLDWKLIEKSFKKHNIEIPKLDRPVYRLDFFSIKKMVDEGLTLQQMASYFETSQQTVKRSIQQFKEQGLDINYIPVTLRFYNHSCGKRIQSLGNSSQHSKKCGCTVIY